MSVHLKGWYVKQTFENDFVDLMESLYKRYGEEVFSIQGIANKHMDIVQFSKEFFGKSGSVADVSVDANANVKEKNIHQYNQENNKSLMKLNSLFLLYKWVKETADEETATEAIEKIVNGEIFVNDLTHAHMPYSYYEQTPVTIKVNGKVRTLTMRDLFLEYEEHAVTAPGMDVIDCGSVFKTIDYFTMPLESNGGRMCHRYKDDILSESVIQRHRLEILDADGSWVPLKRILRHKNERDMIAYQTENGDFALVTDDHPVILSDGSEKKAGDLSVGDAVDSTRPVGELSGTVSVPSDMAYLIGFILGDGNVSRTKFYHDSNNLTNEDVAIKIDELRNWVYVYQKDIKRSRIYSVVKRLLNDRYIEIIADRKIRFSSLRLKMLLAKFFGIKDSSSAFRKALPANIFDWDEDSVEALVAGLIDSDGTVTPSGSINLRVAGYGLVNQLHDVLSSMGVKSSKRICGSNMDWLFGISFTPSSGMKDLSQKLQSRDDATPNGNMDTTPRSDKVSKIFRIPVSEFRSTFSGESLGDYVYDVTTETGTFYANGMKQHNCFAFDLRELLTGGMAFFRGNMTIKPPRRSDTFIALIIQSTAYISNQIVGAASYPDFFVILDWFYRREKGDGYAAIIRKGKRDHDAGIDSHEAAEWYHVKNQFQNFIYSMNFPFRGSQSAFTNLSVMDHGFLETLLNMNGNKYLIPDGKGNFHEPDISSVVELSKLFFEYYSDINGTEGMFTFPVMTLAISVDDDGELIDPEFADWAAEINSRKSLANVFQSSPTSFSSCCRLRNDFSKVADAGYHNSFGVGGLSIGSHRVAGLNLPRIAVLEKDDPGILKRDLNLLHKILYAHRQLIKHLIASGNMPLYTYDWIHLRKQYSTIGFIGAHEYVSNKGLDIRTNDGVDALAEVLKNVESNILRWQSDERSEGNIYNIEQIPGESMAVRLCELDTLMGYNPKKFKIYSNQYIPLIEEGSIYDRFRIQGSIDQLTTGGAILHINVDDEKPLSPVQFKRMMDMARKTGTVYFAVNYAYSECAREHYTIGKHETCKICGEKIVRQYTRVVGFITPVSSWNRIRRDWEYPKRVFYRNGQLVSVGG